MCLAIAGKVMEIKNDEAAIDFGGLTKHASTRLFPALAAGDYVLVHAGFVIQKLDAAYAEELIALDREVGLYD